MKNLMSFLLVVATLILLWAFDFHFPRQIGTAALFSLALGLLIRLAMRSVHNSAHEDGYQIGFSAGFEAGEEAASVRGPAHGEGRPSHGSKTPHSAKHGSHGNGPKH